MRLAVAGINHRTAPVQIREQLAFRIEEIPSALLDIQARGAKEALILSTCNRVEVTATFEGTLAVDRLFDHLLNERPGLSLDVLRPHFYVFEEREAIRHLFRVASSLDSMIVGEPQILGQLKQAYSQAKEQGAIGSVLDAMLTRAFNVAKRIRTETEIGESAVSVSYAAVELAREIFSSLNGKRVLIIGAGKMSEGTARHLLTSRRVRDIYHQSHRTEGQRDGSSIRWTGDRLRAVPAEARGHGHRDCLLRFSGFCRDDGHGSSCYRIPAEPADVSDRYCCAAQCSSGSEWHRACVCVRSR